MSAGDVIAQDRLVSSQRFHIIDHEILRTLRGGLQRSVGQAPADDKRAAEFARDLFFESSPGLMRHDLHPFQRLDARVALQHRLGDLGEFLAGDGILAEESVANGMDHLLVVADALGSDRGLGLRPAQETRVDSLLFLLVG
jgi:hypothetical protein